MLGQLTRQDKADCCLNLPGGDCGLLVVACQRCSLHSNLLENVSNERVQYGHGLGGDTSVWVDLLQDLQGRITTCKLPAGQTSQVQELRHKPRKHSVPCRCRSCSSQQPSWNPSSGHQWISLRLPFWRAEQVFCLRTWVPSLLMFRRNASKQTDAKGSSIVRSSEITCEERAQLFKLFDSDTFVGHDMGGSVKFVLKRPVAEALSHHSESSGLCPLITTCPSSLLSSTSPPATAASSSWPVPSRLRVSPQVARRLASNWLPRQHAKVHRLLEASRRYNHVACGCLLVTLCSVAYGVNFNHCSADCDRVSCFRAASPIQARDSCPT